MAYAKYNRSAVDIISPMLTINQQAREDLRYKEKDFWDKTQAGLKQIGDSLSTYMRHKKVAFIGENELEKLKQELAEAKAELENVQNQMRVIKAEDVNSLDVNQDKSVPAETDVNAWSASGGRMTEYPVNTPYGTQDASMMKVGSKALGGI